MGPTNVFANFQLSMLMLRYVCYRGRLLNVFYTVEICSSRSYRAATYTHYTVEVYCASADCSVQLDFFTNGTLRLYTG